MSLSSLFSFLALLFALTLWLGFWCLVGLGCSGMAKVSSGAGSAAGLLLGPIGVVLLLSLAIARSEMRSNLSNTIDVRVWDADRVSDPFA